MNKLLLYIRTALKLGLWNVAYVIWYRFGLLSGIRKYKFPVKDIQESEDYFLTFGKKSGYPEKWREPLIEDAKRILSGYVRYYARHWKNVGNPPDWFLNPFNGKYYPDSNHHWTKLPDFHPEFGDIKNVWEASRFEWVVTLARAYVATGDKKYLGTLNEWLKDWSRKNPLNIGPNWKCGQEASIRVFNLLNASFILDQNDKPSVSLMRLVYFHLHRIHGNILYAIAQNNNHGTSEAAALFIGGNWLKSFGMSRFPKAVTYACSGKKWLENRVKKLIDKDGSFSQHSVNYHRVMLDTLCFAEFWRRKLNIKPFSSDFYNKAKAASNWLWMLTDPISGSAPNLGANDGAMLLNTHSCDFRNYRPAVQLSHVLFKSQRIYDEGCWDEPLFWFSIETNDFPEFDFKRESRILDKSYAVFINNESWSLIRLPFFKFRPSHNDVFHFDLWHKGRNVLCDAGSYSYNPDNQELIPDLKSVHFHNTAAFDEKDQMPRLGRFLLANWIAPESIKEFQKNNNLLYWEGSYIDYRGNRHYRKILAKENEWTLEDRFGGEFSRAKIGFNISEKDINLNGNIIQTSWGEIVVKGASGIYMKTSYCSEYYQEKYPTTRFSIIPDNKNYITTKIFLYN